MRLRALSVRLAVPATVVLVVAAGVSVHCIKSRQFPDAPPVSLKSIDPNAPAGGEAVPAVSRPSDRPSLEALEANNVEPVPSQPAVEVEATEMISSPVSPLPAVPPLAVGYTIRGKVVSRDGPVGDGPGGWPQMLSVAVSAPDFSRRCEIDEQGCPPV